MILSDKLSGRENNLNLLRFVAAFAVLVSHSFVLATGILGNEPLRASLGMTMGDLAVDIFFTASGFLVARSLVQRQSGIEFLWARLLRIYPALIAMVVLCVFVVAPLYGTLPLSELLTHRGTRHFVFQNLTLVRGVELSVPGLFLDAPWKGIVNGSLWTMTYELRLYLSLVTIWWILSVFRSARPRIFKWTCLAIAGGAFAWQAHTLLWPRADINGLVDPVPRLVLMFYSGAAWWIISKHVVLDARILAGSALAVAATRLTGSVALFHLAASLWLPYAVWWFAFVPSGPIRAFNRIGDSSYGIYIYAFPIQQMWAVSFPGASVPAMIVGTGTATVVLGLVSWHFLEERALSYKDLPRRLLSRYRTRQAR